MHVSAGQNNDPVVLALLENLFFAAKLNEAAKMTGLRSVTARTARAAIEKAQELQPLLIVIDLDAVGCEPFAFIQQCKAEQTLQQIPLLGFVSHVNTGVQLEARRVGCDRVVARSVFSRDLPTILQEANNGNHSC